MKTIILYDSKHGCTEHCAEQLSRLIPEAGEPVSLRQKPLPDPAAFDTIIIGGSIHAGSVQKRVKKFCRKNLDLLLSKRIGLFLCCMREGEGAEKQFNEAFPQALREKASARGLFGGQFNFDKMNPLEQKIIGKISGVTASLSRLREDHIEAFAMKMKGE